MLLTFACGLNPAPKFGNYSTKQLLGAKKKSYINSEIALDLKMLNKYHTVTEHGMGLIRQELFQNDIVIVLISTAIFFFK